MARRRQRQRLGEDRGVVLVAHRARGAASGAPAGVHGDLRALRAPDCTARVATGVDRPSRGRPGPGAPGGESRVSRIDQVAKDFRLLDGWDVPAEGGRDDFGRLVDIVSALDPARAESKATRALFALRFRIGALL